MKSFNFSTPYIPNCLSFFFCMYITVLQNRDNSLSTVLSRQSILSLFQLWKPPTTSTLFREKKGFLLKFSKNQHQVFLAKLKTFFWKKNLTKYAIYARDIILEVWMLTNLHSLKQCAITAANIRIMVNCWNKISFDWRLSFLLSEGDPFGTFFLVQICWKQKVNQKWGAYKRL